jgi:hypothetical protein
MFDDDEALASSNVGLVDVFKVGIEASVNMAKPFAQAIQNHFLDDSLVFGLEVTYFEGHEAIVSNIKNKHPLKSQGYRKLGSMIGGLGTSTAVSLAISDEV